MRAARKKRREARAGGDPPTGAKEWTATDAQFKTATDLVRFIRKEYTGL